MLDSGERERPLDDFVEDSSATPDAASNPPDTASAKDDAVGWISGLRVVSLLTLASRVLGLARDVLMASVFGNGAVMDAFSVAFRIPNLARRVFGEGALSAALLPAFVREFHQRSGDSAWKLIGTVLVGLSGLLAAIVLIGELLLWAAQIWWDGGAETQLLLFLAAVMLPYLLLICLAAQFSAALHAQDHFTWPALLPVVLNVVWIATLLGVVPRFETPAGKITAVAVTVVIGGVLQFVSPLPLLFRLGFRFQADWANHKAAVRHLGRTLLPVLLGLSITQLNALADSLIAWGFSAPESGSGKMLLGNGVDYPLNSGTASALYFAQRMYQFPLGVFGVALGTVLFPLFARKVQDGDHSGLRESLELGLRLVIAIGLPAGIGLILLAEPLTALLFQHGAFDADDAAQTAEMIAVYGSVVWAYCGLLIVHRAYYALGDPRTPLRLGIAAVVINVVLNLILIWPFGGIGLPLATAVATVLQVVGMVLLVQSRLGRFNWPSLCVTSLKSVVAGAAMSAACWATLSLFEPGPEFSARFLRVALPFAVAVATFLLVGRFVRLREPEMLFRRSH